MGRHYLKAYMRKQKIIVRSSAEAELCAATSGASEAKGIQSMMCELGFAVKPLFDHRCKSDRTHPFIESAK